MAIFHLSVKTFSRAKAQSAVAAAAYRAGERLEDDRLGEVADYSRRRGVLRDQALLHMPPGAPAWTREQLWNAAEMAETNKDGSSKAKATVAREVEIALPAELDRADAIGLAHDFARWLSDTYQVGVDAQIHEPLDDHDARNLHCHILMTTRELGPDGLGKKTRVLDDLKKNGPEQVEMMRKEWADRVNAALEFRGFDARVDHRSNARRGLAELPTIHEGRQASAASRAEYNEQVRALNAADEQLRDLLAERAQLVAAEAIEQAAHQAGIDAGAFGKTADLGAGEPPALPSFELDPVRQAALKARAAVREHEKNEPKSSPAEPAAPLEELTATARGKIAARRAAEAKLELELAAATERERQATRVLEKTGEKKAGAQAALMAAHGQKAKALPRATVEAARKKLAMYERDKPKADAKVLSKEAALAKLQRKKTPPLWRPIARSKHKRDLIAAEQAAEMARELAAMIPFLFGDAGRSTRGTAKRPIVEDVQRQMQVAMARRDQLDARMARLQAIVAAADAEKARVAAERRTLDGRSALPSPAAPRFGGADPPRTKPIRPTG